MALLAIRTGALSRAPAATLRPLPAERHEEWHGIYRGEQKIGYSHRVRRPTEDGFTVESDTSMSLMLLGNPQSVKTRLVADTDRALALRRFDFQLRSGTIDFAVTGSVHDGVIDLDSPVLGKRTIPVPKGVPLALSETLRDLLAGERLVSGRSFEYSIFDPATGSPASVTLTIGDLERIRLPSGERAAYRVEQRFQGTNLHLWVEPEGTVIKEEGPLGLAVVREVNGRTAMSGLSTGGVDLAALAAIRVTRPIPDPRRVAKLRLRLTQAPASASFSFPPRQRVDRGVLVIEREDLAGSTTYELPAKDEKFREDLRATPFLQIDDAGVRKAARDALGGEHDAARGARLLLDWVHETLAKVPTVSVPNAVQVLAERRGDCNEHAVLFAAMARAAGLPARIASGAVYMPPSETTGGGAFYYHAWNEVWLGEWIAVDPTFGQFPADATHLKLTQGGPENDVALVGMIGELGLEVEEVG